MPTTNQKDSRACPAYRLENFLINGFFILELLMVSLAFKFYLFIVLLLKREKAQTRTNKTCFIKKRIGEKVGPLIVPTRAYS